MPSLPRSFCLFVYSFVDTPYLTSLFPRNVCACALYAYQAQARAHRIGQTKAVMVYRLLSKKTYEMHMFHQASLKVKRREGRAENKRRDRFTCRKNFPRRKDPWISVGARARLCCWLLRSWCFIFVCGLFCRLFLFFFVWPVGGAGACAEAALCELRLCLVFFACDDDGDGDGDGDAFFSRAGVEVDAAGRLTRVF